MKRVARIVRRDVKGVVKRRARGHVRRHVRNQRNVDSVKAAMDNVGTIYVEIHNASINNAEIYNVGMTKMTVNKQKGVID